VATTTTTTTIANPIHQHGTLNDGIVVVAGDGSHPPQLNSTQLNSTL